MRRLNIISVTLDPHKVLYCTGKLVNNVPNPKFQNILSLTYSGTCFHFIPRENIKKGFQGV